MSKFIKGNTYIVTGAFGQRYIVHQVGLKSWRASLFTHVTKDDRGWDYGVLEGNASSLYQRLLSICDTDEKSVFEVRGYNTNNSLRKDMFDILKFGEFRS